MQNDMFLTAPGPCEGFFIAHLSTELALTKWHIRAAHCLGWILHYVPNFTLHGDIYRQKEN